MSRRHVAAAETWHVPDGLLESFAAIDRPSLPPPALWSIEAHLERCPDCRARLTRVMATGSPEILSLVETAQTGLAARMSELPAPPRPRRRLTRHLTGGLLISRLTACVAVLLAAALLDLAAGASGAGGPSWVLLVAPVVPLLGVAASWSRALDPARELVAATPAAGLPLLLWRTCVVLMVLVPAALLADVVTGEGGQAAWLLPCLALTAATLALGSVTDMARAAGAIAGAWAIGIAVPAVAMREAPAVLEPAWLPAWAGLMLLAAAVIAARRNSYRHMLDA